MATQVLTDCRFYIAQYDLSGELNECTIAVESEVLDATAFGYGTRSYVPGLQGVSGLYRGFADNASTSASGGTALFDKLVSGSSGLAGLHTIMTQSGATGEVGYFFDSAESKFSPLDMKMGELAGFEVEFMPRGDLVRGTVMATATTTQTGSINGTAYQLGASTNKIVYSAIHVAAFTGTTLDVVIQSDDNSGMSSATTRITHTQLTGVGSQLSTFTSGTTDDYWRVSTTFSGTSYKIACVVGMLAA